MPDPNPFPCGGEGQRPCPEEPATPKPELAPKPKPRPVFPPVSDEELDAYRRKHGPPL
jgi:hypothetical protein